MSRRLSWSEAKRIVLTAKWVFSPLDEELGILPGSYTPQMQASMTRLGGKMPFAEAVEEVWYSHKTQVAESTLQQVDYTGASPVTTTYTNDSFGLTQVLMVADDGTAQVYNLFGLDLISQDDGSEVRTLLVDGLGSVRLEMVGDVVETATTYEPYGQVLVV